MKNALRRERGISLIVSLVLLLLVTLVALASVRTVVLQSRMSAGSHDRNLAFQAAESAVRAAELRADSEGATKTPASDCADGFCATPTATAATARWLDPAFTGWVNSTATVSADAPVPQVVIENMGLGSNWPGCERSLPVKPQCQTQRYRITARSAADGRADVMLQSEFAKP